MIAARILCLGAVFGVLSSACHKPEGPADIQPTAEAVGQAPVENVKNVDEKSAQTPASEPATAAAPSTAGKHLDGPTRTTLNVAGAVIEITLADVAALRRALLERLRVSNVEKRDDLIRATEQAPSWIDGQGVLHIGSWALLARGAAIFLRYALPHGDVGAMAYLAAVQRAGAVWSVTDVRTELVHFRR